MTRHLPPQPALSEDRRLQAAAVRALRGSGYPGLARLHCEARDGVLTVSGVVGSYYLKQVTLAVLSRLDHVRRVRNLVQVS